jgi:hypothetical protein
MGVCSAGAHDNGLGDTRGPKPNQKREKVVQASSKQSIAAHDANGIFHRLSPVTVNAQSDPQAPQQRHVAKGPNVFVIVHHEDDLLDLWDLQTAGHGCYGRETNGL